MQTLESEAAQQLQEKLNDPKVANALIRLLDRADELEQAAQQVSEASQTLPGMVAAGADVVDELCRKAGQSGVDVEARFQSLMDLFLRVTEPKNMMALENLVARLPQLEEASRLIDEVPNLVATMGDVFEDYARQAQEQGIDIEKSASQSLRAVLLLGSRIDDQTLATLSNAAKSLTVAQSESCKSEGPARVGAFGVMQAMSNPDVQKSLGFAMRFAKCFGSTL